eukprot:TRINITY_DN43312_c0_g1_i1.p1 TRINITY_DN43312_c0_g1~~TRINITY_DN43312_c0_g1_i1.p1  ORF type:complete len:141 (+),score=35.96 TRINITY_DN43312_c0_g1_i1:158-580(+)
MSSGMDISREEWDSVDINDQSIPLAVRLSLLDRDFEENDYEVLLSLDDAIDRSAPKSAVDSIPEFLPTAEQAECLDKCCVCLSGFKATTPARTLSCGHTFHSPCLATWLSNYNSFCPLCKMQIATAAEPGKTANSTPASL